MNSDTKYWENFYLNINTKTDCSDFCNFVIEYFKNITISNIVDCGCGNGRDSYALSKYYNVDAVDNCGFLPENKENVKFSKDDFVSSDKGKYDLLYSRFTFHSITDEQHALFLDSINTGSYLAIETRSKKGEEDEVFHGKSHYRNYTDLEYLKNLLKDKGFEILFIDENKDFAKYKNENPICIRVICKKVSV